MEIQASICSMSHLSLKEDCIGCTHLQITWYEYLEYFGFIDIEKSVLLRPIQVTHSRNATSILEYFLWATESLHQKKFKSEKDQEIWTYYVEGLTRRQMEPVIGLDQSSITRRIKVIEKYLKKD